jgi:N-acetyl sugar amidotransferase
VRLFRCVQCLYPSTKPDLHFDPEGFCSACIAFQRRSVINWEERKAQFLDLVHANKGKSHDVIVACSGGKDSTAQIVKCLELGLRPLAVTATTDHLSELGRKNLDNISNLCTLREVTPHKSIRRKLAKFALQEVGDISWCEHHLIWSAPAQESIKCGIPIVLYGECPQNEYGAGPPGSEDNERLTKSWVDEFGGLLGLRLADLSDILDIDQRDLDDYRHPGDGCMAVFMGAYFPWDGYKNYLTARANGFTPYDTDVEGSLGRYENLDNLQTGIHDYLRYLKFGYGRAVDIASNHIRRGMSRDAAIDRIAGRDGAYPHTYLGVPLRKILRNIDMSVEDFDRVCARFTNHQVVEWASSAESYRHFYGTSMVQSKGGSSTPVAA